MPAITAPAGNDIETLVKFCYEARDIAGVVLKIGVKRHDNIALCLSDTRSERGGLAEIVLKTDCGYGRPVFASSTIFLNEPSLDPSSTIITSNLYGKEASTSPRRANSSGRLSASLYTGITIDTKGFPAPVIGVDSTALLYHGTHMCGIAGYMGAGDESALRRMAEAIKHRGPDGTGFWRDDVAGVGLTQARLAIIDLSKIADQPMADASGRYVIVFNGEIYNFKKLRDELRDYPFKTKGDTEVILAAYAAWGTGAFARIEGMFALAIYDKEDRELMLVRDRLGKKPLYWYQKNNVCVFGSEIKALRAHGGVPREIDTRSLAHYLAREYVPTPRRHI